MQNIRTTASLTLLSSIFLAVAIAQTPVQPPRTSPPNRPENVADIPVNYDESKVGTYTLPDPSPSRRQARPRRKTWNDQTPPRDRQALRRTAVRPRPRPPRRHDLRRHREGNARLRRQSHPPTGHHLPHRRSQRPQNRSPRISSRRRQKARPPAAQHQLHRQLQRRR